MLYHVSTDLSQVTSHFEPRVPTRDKRMKGENDYIPRICLGKSIEDCLSAMPEGGYSFQSSEKPNRIRVYEFEEEQVHPDNLIASTDLYFAGWVQDAWVTGEYWVVEQPLVPARIYDIELEKVKVIDAPYVSPEEFKEAILKRGNPASILDELEENSKESVARITELTYRLLGEKSIY